jgi:PAS domain S-box-containing protein
VESLNAIAWQMDPSDFRFTYVAPQAERLLGYPTQEWLKPGFVERILHPDDARRRLYYFDREIQAGRDHSMDYRMLAADGREVWVRDIVTISPQDGSQMLRGLLIDITETKRTEQALALSEQKFSSVFHSCPDIIVLLDQQDGRFLAVNNTFEQKLGISAVEAIGLTSTELGLWAEQGSGPRILRHATRRQ